jgi:hypothetical protein
MPTLWVPGVCVVCGEQIADTAARCKHCKASQTSLACRLCGAFLAKGARYCNECKTYQGWRSAIPGNALVLSLIASVLSLIGLLAPQVLKFLDLRSKTSGYFLDTRIDKPASGSEDDSVILVTVTNEGLRPARVEHASLNFGTPRILDADLEILNRDALVIPPKDSRDLKLYADALLIVGWPAADAKKAVLDQAKADLGKALCEAKVTLSVTVVERNRLGNLEPERDIGPLPFVRGTARKWVFERIGGDDPGDCPS